jgi:acyl-CoA thioesterase I
MRQQICSVAIASALAFGCLLAGAEPTRPAVTETGAPACVVPKDLVRLKLPLRRTARQLEDRRLTLIAALGSSFTAGMGARSAEAAYPSRLMVELAQRFPTQPLMVLHRGIPGARAVDVLARFDDSADHPDLVLWEVGTDAILRGYEHAQADTVIREGITRMKASGADVVLIDPPFAPAVIAKPEATDMVNLIANTAAQEGADVFSRFALMRHWHEVDKIPFETFLSSDKLQMNDWGHSCVAKALADAIADAAAPDGTSGKENPRLDDSAAVANTTGQTH